MLTKYERMGASSRMRSIQYEPYLRNAGFDVTHSALLDDDLLERRYRDGRYAFIALLRAYLHRVQLLMTRRRFDLVWIEKEAFPWWPLVIEAALLTGVPYVLDFDDATFHNYDLSTNRFVRILLSSRLDRLMSKAALVACGNGYLAQRAMDAGASWTEIVPTVVDLERYSVSRAVVTSPVPYIVWIGSPSTAKYLALLHEPLRRLALETSFVLRVIGAEHIVMPGVDVEIVRWSEQTEVASMIDCAIGIMPLQDSPWERGKCGYKLIQYMACGLPVVASAVGANSEIVDGGIDGILVNSTDEWVSALGLLLNSPELRAEMGRAGRRRVEKDYCLQKSGPRLAELMFEASKK